MQIQNLKIHNSHRGELLLHSKCLIKSYVIRCITAREQTRPNETSKIKRNGKKFPIKLLPEKRPFLLQSKRIVRPAQKINSTAIRPLCGYLLYIFPPFQYLQTTLSHCNFSNENKRRSRTTTSTPTKGPNKHRRPLRPEKIYARNLWPSEFIIQLRIICCLNGFLLRLHN